MSEEGDNKSEVLDAGSFWGQKQFIDDTVYWRWEMDILSLFCDVRNSDDCCLDSFITGPFLSKSFANMLSSRLKLLRKKWDILHIV